MEQSPSVNDQNNLKKVQNETTYFRQEIKRVFNEVRDSVNEAEQQVCQQLMQWS